MDLPLEFLELSIIKKGIKKRSLIKEPYLEVGCGDGFNLEQFSKLGMKGIGIDSSADAIRAAAKKDLGVTLLTSDFLTARPETFQSPRMIFMLNVLEHVSDDARFLRKAFALLPSHGYLIVALPKNQYAYGFADQNAGHIRRYDEEVLRNKLKDAGFVVEEWLSVGFPVNRSYTWLFNFLNKNKLKHGNPSQTDTSGIRHQRGYYGGIFDIVARISFPILKVIIQIDRLFLHTNLGNNFVVFARKL